MSKLLALLLQLEQLAGPVVEPIILAELESLKSKATNAVEIAAIDLAIAALHHFGPTPTSTDTGA